MLITHCAYFSSPLIDTGTVIPPEPTQCVASLPTVHMSPVHLMMQVHWYSLNPVSVCQTYPLCMSPVIHAVFGKLTHGAYVSGPSSDTDSDNPWIHSVCYKLTHCACGSSPSVDAGTMILPESTQCVANASITTRLAVVTTSIRIWKKIGLRMF